VLQAEWRAPLRDVCAHGGGDEAGSERQDADGVCADDVPVLPGRDCSAVNTGTGARGYGRDGRRADRLDVCACCNARVAFRNSGANPRRPRTSCINHRLTSVENARVI